MTVRCAAALVCLLAPVGLGAQLPPERRLDGPVTRLSHDFVSITSVRELRDGRVLVTDPRGDLFAVADVARDEVTAVGRRGRGPGEYDWPAPIFRLGGDSSLMVIASSRRWLLLDGARIVSTLAADAPAVRLGLFPLGADSLGNLLVSVSPRPSHGVRVMGPGDSTTLVLLNRHSGDADSEGRTRTSGSRVHAELDADGRVRRVAGKVHSPLEIDEPARLHLDGWIAVVRRDPYRVDWRAPNGAVVRGPEIRFDRVVIDPEMRRAIIRAQWPTVDPPFAPTELPEWPATLPPFLNDALVEVPDGRIAIRRAGDPRRPRVRYDVVDRTGIVRLRIDVPARIALVHWGVDGVYGVETDEDLAQWLTWHPWSGR